jgi:antitoxin component of RelBE/YafQ-DinJ toxin-antitoxin module
MAPKTLLSVRIPTLSSNRLQANAEDLGLPLSSYVRQLLSSEINQQDIVASLQSKISATLTEHDARMTDTLSQLLDKYTGQGA